MVKDPSQAREDYSLTSGSSGRLRKSGPIIRGEFLNSFARELVLYVEAVPRLFRIEFFVRDRSAGSAVLEPLVGHREIIVGPQLQDFRGHSHKVGFKLKAIKQMLHGSDTGGQHQHMAISSREHSLNVLNQVHTVLTRVVQTS